MKTQFPQKFQALPLQLLLITPFVLQIFGAVSLVGYLSFKNGQKAVNDLADQLMERTSNTVDQHLNSYLSTPHKLIQINADLIKMGLLNVRDRQTVEKYFWHQMKAYDLSYIGVGLTTGDSIGVARYDGKTLTIDDARPKPPNNALTYATDEQGNRTQILSRGTWDNFQESWYTEPVKAGKPIWSRIYTWNYPDHPYIAASAGRPIYDAQNKLLGMVAADIHLLKLSDFLRNLKVSQSGQVFIIERNGMLIANSGKAEPFTIVKDEIRRLKAIESLNPIVQTIATQLEQRFNNFQNITTTQKLHFNLKGEPYYVHVTPWRDQYGLDWLVVVSVPEKDFMAEINTNTRITIWLCLGALGVASAIGIFTSRWIVNPILRLSEASKAIALGDLDQDIENSSIKELNTLAHSFNYMAIKLGESFTALEKSNDELENRVEERTIELKNALNDLQLTQVQVIQSEKMSSLGQLVAGIAHEINNPVNFIHGNLIHAVESIENLLDFVQLYQEHYPHPDLEIQNLAEDIDLEFLQEDLPKILSSMQIGTSRIREIVLSLRNFSRMDEADIKPVNIHEGIDSTLMILQHRLKARPERPEIEVIKDYGTLPLVECYAGQLNQVFMNILTNAIDAMEEGNLGKTFQEIEAHLNQIRIHTFVIDSQWVQMTITDNGPGMPQHIQEKIFNPFFTTKPVGKGTGMGMSISYQIITEKHRGKLECFSTLGKGSEFVIQLPLRQLDHT
jgi:signal transduction histidine kinase